MFYIYYIYICICIHAHMHRIHIYSIHIIIKFFISNRASKEAEPKLEDSPTIKNDIVGATAQEMSQTAFFQVC